MSALVPLTSSRDAARFGHKAAGLATLLEVPGLRVPPGFAVEVAAFAQHVRSVLPAGQWPERLAQGDSTARRADRLEAIRARLEQAPLDPAFEGALVDAWRALGAGAVAVRSSALHEDAAGGSAAGLQETVLNVRGEEALRDAVRRVWSSIFTERAMTYLARALRGTGAPVGVAVVVQRMVAAERAGVLFTADPLRDDPGIAVIEATRGLGCAVVDGVVSPEVLRVRRVDGAVISRQGASLAEPVLSHLDVQELLRAADAVERAAGSARDIEWCFADGALWLLQSRPIVRRSAQRVGHGLSSDRSQWVWSNVNVGEALPGVATPLTWSVAAKFSDHGFRSAFHSLGCEVPVGAELVGSFHGRIYLNLTHFMQVARQVPALNARMLLEFGGGGGAEEIERQVEPGRWGPFLRRAPAVGLRLAAENARLDGRLAAFERAFGEARRRSESRALGSVSNDALAAALDDAHTLLDHTGRVMLSCASGYLGSVVAMRALLRRVVPGEAERFEQELLAGFSDLESAAPGVALFHIAEVARAEPEARTLIATRSPASLQVEELPLGPTRRAMTSFLKAYGFRCPREAELATPRWREDPSTLFAAIRAHLLRDDRRGINGVERQGQIRAESERALEARLPPVGRSLARHLLARTQRFARLRERMRARVTEALWFVREVAVEASRRMAARFPLAGEDAAFFLSMDELLAWLRGQLGDPSVLVRVRRAQHERDLSRPDPPSTFVGAPPELGASHAPTGDRWTGVAASPGVITGTVRVLRSPRDGADLRPGEVLVTSVADVGWTPLFLIASAVVTELGGALSHAALVAREYGVPFVANVGGATHALRTGDVVLVDGAAGVVERLTQG